MSLITLGELLNKYKYIPFKFNNFMVLQLLPTIRDTDIPKLIEDLQATHYLRFYDQKNENFVFYTTKETEGVQ